MRSSWMAVCAMSWVACRSPGGRDPREVSASDAGSEAIQQDTSAGTDSAAARASPACVLPGRGQHDEVMFRALVANRWGSWGQGLDLNADGTFSWHAATDVVSRHDVGQWDFRRLDARSGVLLLGGDAAISFSFEHGGLCLLADNAYRYPAGEALPPTTQSRDALSQVGPPVDWCLISARPYLPRTPLWGRPDRVALDPLGTARIKDDGAEIAGHMSRFEGEDHLGPRQAWAPGERVSCVTRGVFPDWRSYDRTSGGGQWLFGQRFDPAGIGGRQDLLDSRYAGNEVNGTFVGKPIPGGGLTLHLQLRLYEDDTLEGETLTMQPMLGERHGVLVPAGEPEVVWSMEQPTVVSRAHPLNLDASFRVPDADAMQLTLGHSGHYLWRAVWPVRRP